MNIVVENSTWNNIGDAFYQVSLVNFMKSVFPEHKILQGDGPIERAFRPSSRFRSNAYSLMNKQLGDMHVFSGPILRDFPAVYGPAIRKLRENGASYGLVSCSSADSTERDVSKAKEFLSECPPSFFATRDRATYDNFKDEVPLAYDGICAAFMISDLDFPDIRVDEKYYVTSFYRDVEPRIINSKEGVEKVKIEQGRRFLGLPWSISRHIDFLRDIPARDAGDPLRVRSHQSISYRFSHLNFGLPNTFISYNPLSYFSLYRAAEFVISDRVHACAAAVALGTPAILTYHGERAGIFDRLELNHLTESPMRLAQPVIKIEAKRLGEYLRSTINATALKSIACQ